MNCKHTYFLDSTSTLPFPIPFEIQIVNLDDSLNHRKYLELNLKGKRNDNKSFVVIYNHIGN